MTSEEFFNSFSAKGCVILKMFFNKNTLVVYFASESHEDDDREDVVLCSEVTFHNIENFQTFKRTHKIVFGKKKFNYEKGNPSSAWVDENCDNLFKLIKRKKDGTIEFHIVTDKKKKYIISFTCEDIDVVNKKIVGFDNISDYYEKLVKNNSSEIHYRKQTSSNCDEVQDDAPRVPKKLKYPSCTKIKFFDLYMDYSFHDGCATAYKIKDSNEIAVVLFVFGDNFRTTNFYLLKGNIEFSKVDCVDDYFKLGIEQELFSITYQEESNDYLVDEMYGNSCVIKVDEIDIVEVDKETDEKFSGLEQEYLPDEALKLFEKK
jgi:hypothetical protein